MLAVDLRHHKISTFKPNKALDEECEQEYQREFHDKWCRQKDARELTQDLHYDRFLDFRFSRNFLFHQQITERVFWTHLADLKRICFFIGSDWEQLRSYTQLVDVDPCEN